MPVTIAFDPQTLTGQVSASADVVDSAWRRIVEAIVVIEPDVRVRGRSITASWATILSVARDIARYRAQFGFGIMYDAEARIRLDTFRAEVQAAGRLAEPSTAATASPSSRAGLAAAGFVRRELTPQQGRDLERLLALRHGANFSVPGAGKTTVALAVHLITKEPDWCLLVVAPKNAFVAWEEVVLECLDPDHPGADVSPFVRLSGGPDEIRQLLTDPLRSRRLLVSYEQLVRSLPDVAAFMVSHPTHLVLDESHRIKAGIASQRGTSALSIAPLARRRDILSGTPLPNSLDDIVPQLGFLWPGQGLGERVVAGGSPSRVVGGLYVRTTKNELGLGPIARHFLQVEMSETQAALYGVVRSELLRREVGIRGGGSATLEAARRSVMRLLQVASNPTLLVNRLTDDDPENYLYDDPSVRALFIGIYREGDSPKVRLAADLARDIARCGEKVVIWSSFTGTVERLALLLNDLGGLFIHGGVPVGDPADSETREARIAAFNDVSSSYRVLVANPAACGEGISLHRACHHAVYVDRSFNAGHYLQSVDRIHRLGVPKSVTTHVHVLESVAPRGMGSIDFSVRRRLVQKLRAMVSILNDQDLQQLLIAEEDAPVPIDRDVSTEDLLDLLRELRGEADEALPDEA